MSTRVAKKYPANKSFRSTIFETLTSVELENLPGEDELPYDDGEPLETERHLFQIFLLIETLRPWLRKLGKGYVGGNMFLYFSPRQIKNEKVKGPDFFVVTDAGFRERKSWVVWEEGLSPNVVIELLSDTTKNYDKTGKKTIYESELYVNEYFWYDPHNSDDWAGYELVQGVYQRKESDIRGRYVSKELDLALVKWRGTFLEIEATWLRFETLDGILLPTKQEREEEAKQIADKERLEKEKQKQIADKEKQRADKEKQRADKLTKQLQKLGIDPDEL